MKKNKIISTKVDKDADAVRTDLTIDLTGLTQDDVAEYACMHLVVKRQDTYRRAGKIPAKDTFVVPKPGVRTAESVEDRIARMTPEEKAALIASLQAQMNAK